MVQKETSVAVTESSAMSATLHGVICRPAKVADYWPVAQPSGEDQESILINWRQGEFINRPLLWTELQSL